MNMTQRNRLLKEQWEQMTHEEKRALAQKHLAVALQTSKSLAQQQARHQTQDAARAMRKQQEEAPMQEGFKEHMASQRRLMKG